MYRSTRGSYSPGRGMLAACLFAALCVISVAAPASAAVRFSHALWMAPAPAVAAAEDRAELESAIGSARVEANRASKAALNAQILAWISLGVSMLLLAVIGGLVILLKQRPPQGRQTAKGYPADSDAATRVDERIGPLELRLDALENALNSERNGEAEERLQHLCAEVQRLDTAHRQLAESSNWPLAVGPPPAPRDERELVAIRSELTRLATQTASLNAAIEQLRRERVEPAAPSPLAVGSVPELPRPTPVATSAVHQRNVAAETPFDARAIRPGSARDAEWVREWRSIRSRLEDARAHDENLRADLETQESYWDVLVEKWRDLDPPAENRATWGEWWLTRLDYHLFEPPPLRSDQECGSAAAGEVARLREIIEQAQAIRREELRAEFGVERIEGEPGTDAWRAQVIDRDDVNPPQDTDNPRLDFAYCRVVPGRGGYRFDGGVLRPTYAVYYRYQG